MNAARTRRRSGWVAVAVAATALCGTGCAPALAAAGWGDGDPMRSELERLEKAQRRREVEEARLDRAAREAPPKTPEERLRRGDAHLAAGNLPDALWEYAAAHRLDPESPAPRVRLGYVHLRSEPERARPLFESALAAAPDDVSAHIGLGLALMAADETRDGLAHLERAVVLAPRSAKAHAALGVSLDRLERHDEAVAQLEAARDLAPNDSRVLNNLGVAYLRAGRPADAESALRAALRLDRRDETLRSNNLGIALALQRRHDEALESFRRAGDEQGAQSNLGYVRYLLGEYDAAIEHFERALVVGGDADVQVVRNLEAARHAKQTGGVARRRVPPVGDAVVPAGRADLDPAADLAHEPAPPATEPEPGAVDDPWLRAPPPGAPAR